MGINVKQQANIEKVFFLFLSKKNLCYLCEKKKRKQEKRF